MSMGTDIVEISYSLHSSRPRRIGLVVLASDATIEAEFQSYFHGKNAEVIVARIENSPHITPETLAAMASQITQTAELFLPGDEVDCLAYACTSASTVIGTDEITRLLQLARTGLPCTNPVSAAHAWFSREGLSNLAVLTPYRDDVNAMIKSGLEANGQKIVSFGSFHEEFDYNVALIDEKSLKAAARLIAVDEARNKGVSPDGLFISCTAFRAMHILDEISHDLGIPVSCSNHAMASHIEQFLWTSGEQS